MSQLRYQCFYYSNTFLMVLKQHFWYVQVTHKSYFIIKLFCVLSLRDTSYYVTTTFFQIPKTVFLITLEIRQLLICSTTYGNTIQLLWVFGPHFWINFLWNVCLTYWNNGTVTFRFCLLLRRIFSCHNYSIYLFKWFRFLMASELRCIIEIVETCELRIEVTL